MPRIILNNLIPFNILAILYAFITYHVCNNYSIMGQSDDDWGVQPETVPPVSKRGTRGGDNNQPPKKQQQEKKNIANDESNWGENEKDNKGQQKEENDDNQVLKQLGKDQSMWVDKDQEPQKKQDNPSKGRGNRGNTQTNAENGRGNRGNRGNRDEPRNEDNNDNGYKRYNNYNNEDGGGRGGYRGRGRGGGYNRDNNNNYERRPPRQDRNEDGTSNNYRGGRGGQGRGGGGYRNDRGGQGGYKGNNYNNGPPREFNRNGDHNFQKNKFNNDNQKETMVKNQIVQEQPKKKQFKPIPKGRRCWPQSSIYVLKTLISISYRKIFDHKNDAILIPYKNSKMDVYPGSIVNHCKADYRGKIDAKGDKISKPGTIYPQRCTGEIPNWFVFAFMKLQEQQKQTDPAIIKEGLKQFLKLSTNIPQPPVLSFLIPYSKHLGDFTTLVEYIIQLLQTNTQIKEVTFTTNKSEDFIKMQTEFLKLISKMMDEIVID